MVERAQTQGLVHLYKLEITEVIIESCPRIPSLKFCPPLFRQHSQIDLLFFHHRVLTVSIVESSFKDGQRTPNCFLGQIAKEDNEEMRDTLCSLLSNCK